MEVKKESPNNSRTKPLDLNEVEMIGSPHSRRSAKGPDVHVITNERKQGKEPQATPTSPDSEVEAVPTQPLLEPDRGRQLPPLAGPEVDDLDGDEKPTNTTHKYPGIDDGLLETDKKPNGIDGHEEHDPEGEKEHKDDGATDDGNWRPHRDEIDFPYGDLRTLVYDTHHAVNGFGGFPDRPISPIPGSIPDVNTYQQKKNLAQGMMDLALLSANANQLRYVLESSSSHPYYFPSLTFISLSIVLQVAVGVGLIMNSRYNVKDEKDICKADKINNMTVLGVFLITIVNVFITSFSVATPNTTTTAVQTIGTG